MPIDPKIAELGDLHLNNSALCHFVVTASPQLETLIEVLRAIASSGAQLESLETIRTGMQHRYDITVTHLVFDAAADLAARLDALVGVVSATFESWRLNFQA